MPEIEILAPAKLNLVLKVLGKRKDGYHELFTVFQKITWFDVVTLSPAREISLEIKGEVEVPLEGNLCLQAASLFFERSKISQGVKITLYKVLPVGAGLGGGSSDAAAVLKGLNQLYPTFEEDELLELGRHIGADVPFLLSAFSTALARGIGEKLSPWPIHPAWYLVLCPPIKVSTREAYRLLRLTTWQEPPNYEPGQPLWSQGLVNDFEAVVFAQYPALKEIKARLLKLGAQAALLTGSGAALFGVFEDEAQAQEVAALFEEEGIRAKVATNYHP